MSPKPLREDAGGSQDSGNDSSGGDDHLRLSRSQPPSESAERGTATVGDSARGTAADQSFRDDDDDDSGEGSGRGRHIPYHSGNWCCRFLHGLNRLRIICGKFINHDRSRLFVVILIVANAILMGIATFDFVTDDPSAQAKYEAVDNIFLIVFTAELGLQFLYHGLRLFLDGWLLFDFIVIVMSWAFAEAQIIRAFRIFRALRLVTRVRILRNLVTALFSVMPKMGSIGMLLFLIMYIFCVMFTQLFGELYEKGETEYDYFSRLDRTFFTLFQIMTFDAWADVARDVMDTYAWSWLLFIIYVVVSGFVIVNLIIAVVCDAIANLHNDELAKLHGRAVDDAASEGDYAEEAGEGGGREEGRRLLASTNGEHGASGEITSSGRQMSGGFVQDPIKSMEIQIKESSKIQEQTALMIDHLVQHLQKLPTPPTLDR